MAFLKWTSLLGWGTGLVLLDRPWGIPRFTSWLSLSSLISFVNLLLISFLLADLIINYDRMVEETIETSELGRLLSKLSSTHLMVFYFILRITFFLNAKKLGAFFNRLYYFSSKNGPLLQRNLKKFDSFIIILSYLCSFSGTVISVLIGVPLIGKTTNFTINALGPVGFGVIFGVFGILPVSISDTITFSIVVATSRAILRIFKEFCEDLEQVLLKWERHSQFFEEKEVQKEEKSYILQNLMENEFKRYAKSLSNRRSLIQTQEDTLDALRQEIIRKYFDLLEIFDVAQNVISPFVFAILMVATMQLVVTVSNVIVIGHKGAVLLNDFLLLMKVAIHLCLLQVGHRIQSSLSKGKTQVRLAFVKSGGKQEMRDIVNALLSWEWKLTGMGFFDVDRRLAAGIISLLLSYVVIIFQLQLALSPGAMSL